MSSDLIQRAAELEQTAAAMRAFAAGKKIQVRFANGDDWETWLPPHAPEWEHQPFRPAPELRTRPWQRPEDVPALCWLRWTSTYDNTWAVLVLGFTPTGIQYAGIDNLCVAQWGEIEKAEYSTDRITWHKCEVTEDAP